MKHLPILLALVLVGCTQPAGPTNTAPSTKAEPPPKLTIKYQGMYADQWAEQLYDADDRVSENAAKALRQIGKEGCYYLLKGMKSEIMHVQFYSMQFFPPSQVVAHKEELRPVLKEWLTKNSAYQTEAIDLIYDGELTEYLPDLKHISDTTDNISFKAQVDRTIKKLSDS